MKTNFKIHNKGNTMAKPSTSGSGDGLGIGKVRTGERRPNIILQHENWFYNLSAEEKGS